VNVAIPPALERLVLACLAKKPADRPSHAGELARALGNVGLEPWTEDEARRWWEEERRTATVPPRLDESAAARPL
jgi:hypothetical protein